MYASPSGSRFALLVVCSEKPPRTRSSVAPLTDHRHIVRLAPAHRLTFGLCVLICCLSLGCVAAVPIRGPMRTIGMTGTGSTDSSFIRVGTTGHDEVAEKLGWIDTGVKEESLFLGRWSSSSWGTAYVMGFGTNGSTGFSRSWKTYDILIEFDDKGVVKRYAVFKDAELVKQLSAWIAEVRVSALDLSTPIEIVVEHHHSDGKDYEGTLVLGKDFLRLNEFDDATQAFTISAAKISKLGASRQADWGPHYISQTIEFTLKTKVGNELTLRMDVPAIVILVKYLAQTRSPKSRETVTGFPLLGLATYPRSFN
jgi:hypothetical protein